MFPREVAAAREGVRERLAKEGVWIHKGSVDLLEALRIEELLQRGGAYLQGPMGLWEAVGSLRDRSARLLGVELARHSSSLARLTASQTIAEGSKIEQARRGEKVKGAPPMSVGLWLKCGTFK